MVIESTDVSEFKNNVTELLQQGYTILSSNCGFINSEQYNFCSIYQAILVKEH